MSSCSSCCHHPGERRNSKRLAISGKSPGNFAASVDFAFKKVFPRRTPDELYQFALLKDAYTEARYNMEYQITEAELQYLSERVAFLRDLTEKTCAQKIASFGEGKK